MHSLDQQKLPTGTEVNYFVVCKRKLWLFAHDIQMEDESERVAQGKNIHEFRYPERRPNFREWEHGPIKLDYFDSKNQVIHEMKLSKKMERAHELQVIYYMYYMKKQGFEKITAVLEYPLLKQKTEVFLTPENELEIETVISEINRVLQMPSPPLLAKISICTRCAYYEFCFAGEGQGDDDG